VLSASVGLFVGWLVMAAPLSQAQGQSYTVITPTGRRVLPFRAAGATDLVSLELLATLFDFRLQEDALTGGMTITAGTQRIVLTSGQPLASISGRIVSLSGPVVHDGQGWFVPTDFLSRALGPSLNTRMDVRRGSHLVVVGEMRVPQLTTRIERQGANGRLVIDVQPPFEHHITREGNRLTVRFDADGLDAGPIAGAQSEFVGQSRVEGASLVIDLGPSSASFRSDDTDPAHVVIDLTPAPAPGAAVPGRPAGPGQEPLPPIDLSGAQLVRTIAIDPGHGGDDVGVRGAGGALEKDVTLQLARRLKAAIESRIGLRVLLTRDSDENVPIDRRTAIANNNKADLLFSLHANGSLRPALRGAQVLSLSLDDYKSRVREVGQGVQVPIAGGGTRLIEAVPWDLAQLPYAAKSASLASILVRHLTERGVPLAARPEDRAPLRILVGANMPAVLIEGGFLSNAADEKALTGGDVPAQIVEALLMTIVEVRGGIAGGTR
jgi:N-acetylmuramoyl-L-alanine amidase